MKLTLQAALLAAIALVPASLASDADKDLQFEPVDGITSVDADLAVSKSLDGLDQKRESGGSLIDEIMALQQQLASMPTDAELRLRLQSILDELIARAKTTYLQEFDLAMARRQMVDARLDRAFLALQERAAGADWTIEQMRSVAMAWLARAEVFVDAPDPEAYRSRIMAAVELAILQASSIKQATSEMRLQLLQLQLEAATSRLAAAQQDGSISEADYDRLLQLAITRARVIYQSQYGG